MDIQLPGMDGIAALKQLRAIPQTQSIPVIAISASAMTNNRLRPVGRRASTAIKTKPISLPRLSRKNWQRVLA